MVIGDKAVFAVELEYTVQDSLKMGYARIWINNRFIGAIENWVYLDGYLLSTLSELRNSRILQADLIGQSKYKLFDMLMSGDYPDSSQFKYRVRSTPFLDDFIVWNYKVGESTWILWKLLNKNNLYDSLATYKRVLYREKIPTQVLESVIESVESELRGIGLITEASSA